MPPLKKSEKIMLAGIGVMIVVFIVMDPYYFIYRKPPVVESAPATGAAGASAKSATQAATPATPAPAGNQRGAVSAVVAPAPPVDKRPKREPIQFSQWGRDPFLQLRRGVEETSSINSLKLGGISVTGKDRYALINSQIMHTGDVIQGMTIARIEKEFVLLTHGGRTYTLTWGQH